MMEGGFTLVRHSDGRTLTRIKDGSYIRADKNGVLDFPTEQDEGYHPDLLDEIRKSRKTPYSIEYEDPWKILQGYSLSTMRDAVNCEGGYKPGRFTSRLHLHVWHGNKLRLQDKIPSSLIPGWTGNKGRKLAFADISDPETKIRFLYERTYWGRKLVYLASGGETAEEARRLKIKPVLSQGEIKTSSWAKRLQRKISFFFEGKPHPSWSQEEVKLIYSDSLKRNMRARSVRFLECLKTVQGIFLQRYLAYPNEEWTWHKFDLFVLKYLTVLLDDEFYDGNLRKETLSIKTRYSELKTVRKDFKMYALSGRDEYIHTKAYEESVPHWLRVFVPIFRKALEVKGDIWSTSIRSILSQTRGMGTPPPLVVYQSKAKFLALISSETKPLTPEAHQLVSVGMELAMKKVPDHVFTGLSTKARITITASACWEKTRQEGGSLQAISELMAEANNGYPAKVVSLYTGNFERYITLEKSEAGEYIFWRALEEVLSTAPEEISQVYVTVVKEPGKARTVTKGMICLKLVLDVINKIVSYPLSKVDTSKSGMGKDAHGWNLFNEFYQNSEESFCKKSQTDTGLPSSFIREVVYEDIFAECTDFVTATDAMHHTVCKIIAIKWMVRCGIPPLLQKIVVKTCFSPRIVHFNGRGIFSHIGEPSLIDEHTRHVRLLRGMMMGDPFTKVILHFTNISIREIGRYIALGSYKELILDNEIRAASLEVDTGPFSVLCDEIIIEDTRPLVTPEGLRQVRTIPARILPNPRVLSLEYGDVLQRIKGPSPNPSRKRVPFPMPGVHILYEKKLSGGMSVIEVGFINKRFRDNSLLDVKSFSMGSGPSYQVTGERNPEDTRLYAEGLIPINPYRSKEIRTDYDKCEADNDHASYLAAGRILSPTPLRVVSQGAYTERSSFVEFLRNFII